MTQMQYDIGWLKDTKLEVFEGEVSECSSCGGETGEQQVDIELRIVHTEAADALKRANMAGRSTRRRRLTPKMFVDFNEQEGNTVEKKPEILRTGLHIRSILLKNMAPTFVYNARVELQEFTLIKACKGSKVCYEMRHDPYSLTPL